MVVLSDEIRKTLGELDSKAQELIQQLEDEYSLLAHDSNLDELQDILSDLQREITEIQEKQGWI